MLNKGCGQLNKGCALLNKGCALLNKGCGLLNSHHPSQGIAAARPPHSNAHAAPTHAKTAAPSFSPKACVFACICVCFSQGINLVQQGTLKASVQSTCMAVHHTCACTSTLPAPAPYQHQHHASSCTKPAPAPRQHPPQNTRLRRSLRLGAPLPTSASLQPRLGCLWLCLASLYGHRLFLPLHASPPPALPTPVTHQLPRLQARPARKRKEETVQAVKTTHPVKSLLQSVQAFWAAFGSWLPPALVGSPSFTCAGRWWPHSCWRAGRARGKG